MGRVIHVYCKSLRFVVEGYCNTQRSANPIHVLIKSNEEDDLPTVCRVKLEAPDLPECIAVDVLESLTEELAAIVDMFSFEPGTDHCKNEITTIANSFLNTLTTFGESVFNLKNS